jgi:hypothetical protein
VDCDATLFHTSEPRSTGPGPGSRGAGPSGTWCVPPSAGWCRRWSSPWSWSYSGSNPAGVEHRSVPVNARLHRKNDDTTTIQHAAAMIRELAGRAARPMLPTWPHGTVIDYLPEFTPDLVLIDTYMPTSTATPVRRHIRACAWRAGGPVRGRLDRRRQSRDSACGHHRGEVLVEALTAGDVPVRSGRPSRQRSAGRSRRRLAGAAYMVIRTPCSQPASPLHW